MIFESGLGEITSPAFVVRIHDEAVGAAGYCMWPSRTAHMSGLTDPEYRRRGLARPTGSAAVTHALEAGSIPQERARAPPSEHVEFALGFRERGAQLSAGMS